MRSEREEKEREKEEGRKREEKTKTKAAKSAAKENRIYLPMRMSCRSGAISPRPVFRSL